MHAPINMMCTLLGGVSLRRWRSAADDGHDVHVWCPSAMADARHVHQQEKGDEEEREPDPEPEPGVS